MVDFSHLASLEIPNEAKPYHMNNIPGEDITLFLLPAGESNKPYWNAALRHQNKRLRGGQKKSRVDEATVSKNRAIDKDLISQYCLVGWKGVHEKDGKAVEFSKENGVEFIQKLPGWLFDPIKLFVGDPENYVDDGIDLDDDDIDDDADAANLGES